MTLKQSLKFRPHHFLCTLGFVGKGYSNEFIKNFREIVSKLDGPKGDTVQIQVIQETDIICLPCPHRRGNTCKEYEKITQLDQAHAKALDIRCNEILTWKEAKKRICQKISPAIFEVICAPCEWKKLGICAKALEKLRADYAF